MCGDRPTHALKVILSFLLSAVGSPQRITCLHLTLFLHHPSVTPTLCMPSFNTSMNLLCGFPLFSAALKLIGKLSKLNAQLS